MTSATYSAAEMMTVAAARALGNDDICFVGIGLPSAACNLARLTHAPHLTLVYESGTLETKPTVLPLSIGDGELCETALTTVSVPEMFQYWLQGGRISVGFLGGAQIDRFGNLNSTVIGPYDKPKVRLPGSGGATEIATGCQRIYVVMRHNPRAFVERLAFVTSLGHGVTGRERRAMGITTEGPVLVVTDLCTMTPDAETKEFEVVEPPSRHHAGTGTREYRMGRAVRWTLSAKQPHRTAHGARGAERPERANGQGARNSCYRIGRAGLSLTPATPCIGGACGLAFAKATASFAEASRRRGPASGEKSRQNPRMS